MRFILLIFLIWRVNLEILVQLGESIIPLREGFLGSIPWANFDGVHYLSIAKNGYFQYQQAFFPLFPLLVRWFSPLFGANYLSASLVIVNFSLIIALFLFWRLLKLNYKESIVRWVVLFFLFFPTGFYLGSVYTESLFLAFVFGAFLAAKKKKWWLAGVLGGLASTTRLVGIFLLPALVTEYFQREEKLEIKHLKLLKFCTFGQRSPPRCPALRGSSDGGTGDFTSEESLRPPPRWVRVRSAKLYKLDVLWLLLIPLGLLSYMFYLWEAFGDPLYFLHAQPFFGAQRSAEKIILLPQVYWRYFKIFLTVSLSNYDWWIAVLEFLSFNWVLLLLWQGYRKKLPLSWLIFSLLTVVVPTLTGTLSSIPRYILASFPIFIVPSLWKSKRAKIILFTIYYLLFTILTILFTRGYWVS